MPMVVRKLGLVETQMSLFHARKGGTTQCMQVIQLTGSPAAQRLRVAAHWLFDNFQVLRCTVTKESDGLYFAESARFEDISVRVTNVTSDVAFELEACVDARLNAVLDPGKSLWAVELVQAADAAYLFLIFHHSIVDAPSLFRIARTVLAVLDGDDVPSQSVCEAVPESVDQRMPAGQALPVAPGNTLGYAQNAPLDARRSRSILTSLSLETSIAVRDFCRRTDIQSNSFLAAATAIEFQRVTGIADPIEIKSAVSLRDGLVPISSRTALACYIATASARLHCTPGDPVRIARDYQAQMYRDVLTNAIKRTEFTLSRMDTAISSVDSAGRFVHGIGLTNLGEVQIAVAFRNFRVVNYWGMSNRNAGNGAVVVTALELAGRFAFSFVWVDPLIDSSTIRTFVRNFDSRLKGCLDGNGG